jgi:bifunctional DNase/RNase
MNREVKILGLSYAQSQLGSYVCVLGETNGHRKLPIIVKPQDAQTIALRVEGMKAPRPLTHDLFKSLSDSFMLDCQQVEIYQVLEGIFYSRLVFNNGVDDATIETTAGDAIALSLVFDCPLYVSEEVLSSCGIQTDEEGNLLPDTEPKPKKSKKKAEPVISVEDLKHMMEEAIANEEYELAAQYRDKITEIENNL